LDQLLRAARGVARKVAARCGSVRGPAVRGRLRPSAGRGGTRQRAHAGQRDCEATPEMHVIAGEGGCAAPRAYAEPHRIRRPAQRSVAMSIPPCSAGQGVAHSAQRPARNSNFSDRVSIDLPQLTAAGSQNCMFRCMKAGGMPASVSTVTWTDRPSASFCHSVRRDNRANFKEMKHGYIPD